MRSGDNRTTQDPADSTGRAIDRVWAVLPGVLPALVGLLTTLGAIDLAYHVRAGNLILDTHRLPGVDTFTFSVAGRPWADQQWAAQIMLAGFYRLGGWATLGVVQAMLVGASFWIVSRAAQLRGATTRAASLLAIGGFVVAAPALALRPQLLALPLVATAVWVVAARHRRPAWLWTIPVLTAVTANIHGSFVLFVLIVVLAWLEDVIDGAPGRSHLLLVAGVSVVASFLNPWGPGVWTYAYEVSTNPVIRETVTEWAPVTLSVGSGGLMIVSALAVAIYVARRSEPTPWGTVVILAVFFLIAMASTRAILWWTLVAPVAIAGLLPPRDEPEGARSRRDGSPAPAFVLVGILVAVIVALLPWWRRDTYASQLGFAPAGLTRAVEDKLPAGSRLFVHQPWGSWFEFAVPEMTVFVDSRIELFPQDVWEDYGEVAFAGDDWLDVLDRWGPDAIVADEGWDLLPRLRDDPGWRVAHEDEDGVLFVRA